MPGKCDQCLAPHHPGTDNANVTRRSASFSKSPRPPLPKSCVRNSINQQHGPFCKEQNLLRHTGTWSCLREATGFSLCPVGWHKQGAEESSGSVTEVCARWISTQMSPGSHSGAPTPAGLGQVFSCCLKVSISVILGYKNKYVPGKLSLVLNAGLKFMQCP